MAKGELAAGEGEELLSPVCELFAEGGVSSSCWWAWPKDWWPPRPDTDTDTDPCD